MASMHPAGDSYNHRPSDLQAACHPTGILMSSCVVWLVVSCEERGSREGF